MGVLGLGTGALGACGASFLVSCVGSGCENLALETSSITWMLHSMSHSRTNSPTTNHMTDKCLLTKLASSIYWMRSVYLMRMRSSSLVGRWTLSDSRLTCGI